MDLIKFFVIITFAQVLTWFQLNSQFLTQSKWMELGMVLLGMPVSYLFIKSTKYGFLAFNEQLWPQRIIGFAIGITIYTILTYLVYKQIPDIKTWICLMLASIIILIQVFWK